MTNTVAASKYIPRRPRISINWNPPFQTQIYLVSSKKNFFWNFMKWGLKGGISIEADSGPPRYVLWCCGGICHQLPNFFKIGCCHTVTSMHLNYWITFSDTLWQYCYHSCNHNPLNNCYQHSSFLWTLFQHYFWWWKLIDSL